MLDKIIQSTLISLNKLPIGDSVRHKWRYNKYTHNKKTNTFINNHFYVVFIINDMKCYVSHPQYCSNHLKGLILVIFAYSNNI